MKIAHALLPIFLPVFMLASAQAQQVNKETDDRLFAASTPCDLVIKTSLGIPQQEDCEFIKWEIYFSSETSGRYKLIASYGMSQPNTNGFIRGGKKITLTGTFSIRNIQRNKSQNRLFFLHLPGIKNAIRLIEIDKNVLHFVDQDNTLLTGNAGFGYALNRIEQKTKN